MVGNETLQIVGDEYLNDFLIMKSNISLANIELMIVSVLQRGIKEIINNKTSWYMYMYDKQLVDHDSGWIV